MTNKINDSINTYSFDDDIIEAGMLSSPQIAYCQERYQIIDGYDESCLSSATYHMRIGGHVIAWENGKKNEFTLAEDDNPIKKKRSSIDLQPNSLTYVTTIEQFNLPKDIIARFNLKSKWVHKGLLLGTGPIVDPEFKGELLIPLHNFSSQLVRIEFEEKIISVEFTKTLNPEPIVSETNRELLQYSYKINTSRPFYVKDFIERGGANSQSSVKTKFDQFIKQMKQYEKSIVRFNYTAVITAVGVGIGLIALIITTWNLVSSTFEQLNDAKNIVKQYQSQNVDYSSFVLKQDYEELKNQFLQLKKYTEQLNTSTYMEKQTQAIDFKNVVETMDKTVEKIEDQLVGMDKEIQRIKEQKE
jgi:deoxycytidine triphosphate deaminase